MKVQTGESCKSLVKKALRFIKRGGFLVIHPPEYPSEAHSPPRQKQSDIGGIDFAIPIQVSGTISGPVNEQQTKVF